MPELIAGIIAYNEERLLPQCLDSIRGKVDRIILVEGRIATFPGDEFRSQDRTLEIAREYDCEIITTDRPWADEAEMRSQYLVGENDDWYILIDADEVCMTPLPKIKDIPDNVHAFSVLVRMISDGHGKYRPRLFRHHGQMQYSKIHDGLFSDGVLISNPNKIQKLHSVWFGHYQMERGIIRRGQKRDYYRDGYAHEPEYRAAWEMTNHD